jgi:RimJ/RimL family protein N-acetyltransferase
MKVKEWKAVPFTETHGRTVCEWRYPEPYAVYDWPPWEKLSAGAEEFADPEIRERQYAAIVDEDERLIGFAQFFPMEGVDGGVMRLGLGMDPGLCGNGLGADFVRLIVEEAKKRAPGHEIDLEVLTWNERAIRTYRKAGFTVTDTYERMTPAGMAAFHCMVYLPKA